jgi:6-phosphogluconolactonase
MPTRHHSLLFLVLILFASTTMAVADEQSILVSSFAAGSDGAIHTFQLNKETGELTPRYKFDDVEHPFFLAVAPNRKFLYSIHAPGKFGGPNNEFVVSYRLTQDGQLEKLNRRSSRGTASCYLDVSPDGKLLAVANYSSGSVAAYTIADDGSLSEPHSFFQHSGKSANPSRQQGPHAHCIVFSPSGKHVLAADLGLDKIMLYSASDNALSPSKVPFVNTSAGTGPRHLTFHPDGRRIYVVNEIGNTVRHFDYDQQSGELIKRNAVSTLPDGHDGVTHTADIKITPNGRFLYATNRGHDSVAAFEIEKDGNLRPLGIHPSLGKGPQNLAIVADGAFLLCANMPSSQVVVFRINKDTGALTPVGEPYSVPSPSCILAF